LVRADVSRTIADMKTRNDKAADIPAYLDEIAKLAVGMPHGTITHVEIKHAPSCDMLNGRGSCNCVAVVRLLHPS
jgi:hypothetical protein